MFIIKIITKLISLIGIKNRLVVLMYHRVLDKQDPLLRGEVTKDVFTWQMRVLRRYFKVISLNDAVNKLMAGKLPSLSVCITFDDGYADNYKFALPVIKEYGLNATFFIATGFLNGGRMWNDSIIEAIRQAPGKKLNLTPIGLKQYDISTDNLRLMCIEDVILSVKYCSVEDRLKKVERLQELINVKLPDDLMMTDRQLLAMKEAGMNIGAHTINHPILSKTGEFESTDEIENSKAWLESLLDTKIETFAYPNGQPGKDYTRHHVEIVKKAGIKVAVSTAWGSARKNSDVFQIPRITSWDKTPLRFALRIIKSYFDKQTAYV